MATTPDKTTGSSEPKPGSKKGAAQNIPARLARVEGQVRGIAKMVDEKRYCIDILTQVAAVHEALRAVSREIVQNHMTSCVARAMRSGDATEAERVSREMSELLDRFTR
ncbi:MAG TPA: metal-sensitive transcriptional regulator [Candidatus Eisenbacteria bacterium]